MRKQIGALSFIFVCTSIAWMILGSVTSTRTHSQDVKLKKTVGQLWGTVQRQYAPLVYYQTHEEIDVTTVRGSESIIEKKVVTSNHPITIENSDIKVNVELEHRKKGLLWYSTYNVVFNGMYTVLNNSDEKIDILFEYTFPTVEGVYDNFSFIVNGEKIKELKPSAGKIVKKIRFRPHESMDIGISYGSQGMDEWWYMFGEAVSHIRNFNLAMMTDFNEIDFPENSISPTAKRETDQGWELTWHYDDLISGIQIGIVMPQKVNPGPFVSRVTFFAPISLFLFFFLMFIITTLKEIKIHPMNYFFIAAAFFSFHLLLAYLADHIDIHVALMISSVVSIFLVISYMRLVTGIRFALLESGISQFVYLVLFSYTFFLTGYTGLAITILCIVTLFVVMQITGRINWQKKFESTQ